MGTKFNARLGVSVGNTPTDVIDANGSITANTLTVNTTVSAGNTTITGFANIVGNVQISDTLSGNNMTLSGNLTVSGTTTYINTTNLNIGDNIITLNADVTGATAPSENAGFVVNRGSSTNTSFLWDESVDSWIFNTGGVEQARISHTAAAVNYLQLTGGVTGGRPYILAAGADANIGTVLATKGTGTHQFWTNGGTTLQFEISHADSAVNYGRIVGAAATGGPTLLWTGSDSSVVGVYNTKGAGAHYFATNNNQQFRISDTASAVNYIQVTGAATAGIPTISVQGSDSNITLGLSSKGTGGISMFTGGAGQFAVAHTASAVNYIQVTGAATGGRVTISSQGSDTNIPMVIGTKGTGSVSIRTNDSSTTQFAVTSTASAVNYINVTGATTTNAPLLSALGSDANVALNISAKASANINLVSNTNFAANTLTFTGSAGSNTSIALRVLSDGVLSFEGGAGQLFSIANSLTGQIFSVNDISGIPSIEVYSNGQINMARFGGNVAIGSNTATITVNGAVTLGNTLTIANNLSVTGFVNATASVNSAVLSVGTSFIANTTGAYHTGTINAASHTVSTNFIANSTGITTTGFANVATTISVGANVIANTTAVFVGNSTVNTVITQNTLQVANATGTSLFVAANGNVGVGNSTPGSKLVVQGSARIDSAVSVGGSGRVEVDAVSFVGGRLTITADPTGNSTNFSPNANVGIGNSAPAHKLRVEGNASITSSLNVATTFASGNATITGFANVSGNLQVADTIAGNNMTLSGNLTVSGTTTYINTTNLNVGDNIITLNADLGAVAPTENAGIEINRGTSANVSFIWDETTDYWTFGGDGANNAIRLSSNSLTTTAYINSSGIWDYYGNTTNINAFAEFSIFNGVNRLDNRTRNYLLANSSANNVIFAANGNVGIGNMTPANKFNVRATSNTNVILSFLENNDTGTGAVAIERLTAGTDKSLTLYAAGGGYSGMYGSATAPTFYYDFDNHNFRKIDGTVLAVFAANGNVGIGNNTPTEKLRIEGTSSITGILTSSAGANAITFSNGTSNYITWNQNGVAAPTVTTRSVGTKLILYPDVTSVKVDYALGIESAHMWFSAGSAAAGFKWYANTTNIMTSNTTGLSINSGQLSVGADVIANATALYVGNSTVNTVITQTTASFNANSTATALLVAANGNIGIGNSTPNAKLLVGGNVWIKPNETGANAIALSLGIFSDTNSSGFDFITDDATSDSLTIRSNRYNGYFNWRRNSSSGEVFVATLDATNGVGTNFNIYNTETDNTVKIRLSAHADSYINSAANVGIGNTTPNAKLQVTGTANISGNVGLGGDLTVAGNLTVSGTTTYINTTTLNIGDNIITLNADLGAVAPSENAGFEVNRGTSANVQFLWHESGASFRAQRTDFATSVLEAYGNNAGIYVTATGNSTSNAFIRSIATQDTATVTIDSSNSIVSSAATGWLEIKTKAYRAGGTYVTSDVAPRGGSNNYWFVGRNYTGTGFQVGKGLNPEYDSNSVIFVSASNNNIGIGNSAPTDTLVIENNAANNIVRIKSTNSAVLFIEADSDNVDETHHAQIILSQDGGVVKGRFGYSGGGNGLAVINEFADSLTLGSNNTGAMVIVANSNIGIGNSTPAHALRIESGVLSLGNSTSNVQISIPTSVVASATNYWLNANGQWAIISGVAAVVGGSNTHIQYNNSGVVDGSAALTFNNTTNNVFIANTLLFGNSTVNTTISSTTASIAANSTTTALLVAANGNIGIGNTTPGSKLTIAGGSLGPITIGQWGVGNYNGINLNGNNIGAGGGSDYNILGDTNTLFINRPAGSIHFRLNNVDQMHLASNGNFGIGNSAPAEKLVVNGTANISGNVTISSWLGIGTAAFSTGTTLSVNKNVTGTTTALGVYNYGTVQSDVTGFYYGFRNNLQTAASATPWTLSAYYHYLANETSVGANNTVTSQYGYAVSSNFGSSANVTYAYGFRGQVAAGANRYNLYMDGTANNVLYGITNVANTFYAGNTFISSVGASNAYALVAGLTIKAPTSTVSQEDVVFRIESSPASGTADRLIEFAQATGATADLTRGVLRIGNEFTNGNAPSTIQFHAGGDSWINSANVGIGNTTPNAKLQVTGTANISGLTTLSGNLTFFASAGVTPTITFTANTNGAATILKPVSNTTVTQRFDFGNAGSNNALNPFWSGYHFCAPDGIANSTGGTGFPRASLYNSYANTTNPTDLYFSIVNGNGPVGVGYGTRIYALGADGTNRGIDIAANGNIGIGNTAPIDKLSVNGTVQFTNSSASVFLAAANGNIGIGNTAPTDKLVVGGNIFANNLRRYTATRTLTTTANDTVEIGTMYSDAGAHSLDITIQVTDSGFSVTKRYLINSPWNATGSVTYRKVLPFFDSGPFSNDYDLEAYHNNQTLGLRVRRTSGSTTGTLEIMIDDKVLQSESTLDYFTPSTTTASGVAAVTDVFPGSRIINGGVSYASVNAFVVQANLTTAAITSNNTSTAFNLPVSFNNSVTIGYGVQFGPNLTTSATTANQVLSTVSSSAYRSAKFLVQVTSGSAYQLTEITLIHDGTNVYKTEYGQVFSGAVLATFDADINSGNMRLLTTPTNAVTVYKGVANAILV